MELVELASYGKFGFSRLDLDGNKLAKSMCLARKARDREVFIQLYQGLSFLNLSPG